MTRQRANLTDLLNENQKYDQLPSTPEQPQQEVNTNTPLTQDITTSIPQNSNDVLDQSINTLTPQNPNTVLPQNDNEVTQQNTNPSKRQSSNTSIPQDLNKVLPQNQRMTDKRDRVTFYLDPGQLEKLEEIKIQYRKKTGIRINEQEIVRRAIDRLDVDFLL